MSVIHCQPGPSTAYPGGYEMDYETSALIAQLGLQDIEQTFTAKKGKSRVDAPLTDEELAYRLQLEAFQDILVVSEDAKLARSIGGAMDSDAAYLEAFRIAEEAAAADRRAAQMLSRGEHLPAPSVAQARLERADFFMNPEITRIPESATDKVVEDQDVSDSESFVGEYDRLQAKKKSIRGNIAEKNVDVVNWRCSVNATAGPSINRNRSVICTICTDRFRYIKVLKTPCDHYYCEACIVSFVERSTRDESLFPPKCCGTKPIPPSDLITFLPESLFKIYKHKEAEFTIPITKRVYCVNTLCATFLGPSTNYLNVNFAVCPACSLRTCPKCKKEAHADEEDCRVNAANIELKALAVKSGWQTCPGCSRLVEKTQGCNHITCRCTTQFCYLCASKWKTCQCPQ